MCHVKFLFGGLRRTIAHRRDLILYKYGREDRQRPYVYQVMECKALTLLRVLFSHQASATHPYVSDLAAGGGSDPSAPSDSASAGSVASFPPSPSCPAAPLSGVAPPPISPRQCPLAPRSEAARRERERRHPVRVHSARRPPPFRGGGSRSSAAAVGPRPERPESDPYRSRLWFDAPRVAGATAVGPPGEVAEGHGEGSDAYVV